MAVGCAQLNNLSEDDDVVAGVVLGPDPAVQPCDVSGQDPGSPAPSLPTGYSPIYRFLCAN